MPQTTHGDQEGSYYHGYYRQHIYHPLLVFDGESGHLISALLRRGNTHASNSAVALLKRVVGGLREQWPEVEIELRADAGFAVPALYDYCKEESITYTALRGTSETAIVGQLLDPETHGAPGLVAPPLATAKLFSGNTLLKSDAINESGFYEMTGLTAGTGRTLKATRSGSVKGTLRNGISIVNGQVAGPSTDALPQARDTGNATITMDWTTVQPKTDTDGCVDACNGWALTLMMKLPSGQYAHPLGSLTEAPFVYFRHTDSHGEANPLEMGVIGSQAADGTYKVVAFNGWAYPSDPSSSPVFNPSWTGSQASVQMYNGAASLGGGLKAVPSTCGNTWYWYVGDLTKSGTSYTWTNKNQNICTNIEPQGEASREAPSKGGLPLLLYSPECVE